MSSKRTTNFIQLEVYVPLDAKRREGSIDEAGTEHPGPSIVCVACEKVSSLRHRNTYFGEGHSLSIVSQGEHVTVFDESSEHYLH